MTTGMAKSIRKTTLCVNGPKRMDLRDSPSLPALPPWLPRRCRRVSDEYDQGFKDGIEYGHLRMRPIKGWCGVEETYNGVPTGEISILAGDEALWTVRRGGEPFALYRVASPITEEDRERRRA